MDSFWRNAAKRIAEKEETRQKEMKAYRIPSPYIRTPLHKGRHRTLQLLDRDGSVKSSTRKEKRKNECKKQNHPTPRVSRVGCRGKRRFRGGGLKKVEIKRKEYEWHGSFRDMTTLE